MKLFEGYPLRKILKREQAMMWLLSPIFLQIVIGNILVLIFLAANPQISEQFNTITELNTILAPLTRVAAVVGTFLGVVLLIIIIIWRKIPLVNRKRLSPSEWKIIPGLNKKDWQFLAWYIPFSYILYIIGNITMVLIFGEPEVANQEAVESLAGTMPMWLMFLMVVVAAPIGEELLFRGLVMFRKGVLDASWFSVAISAVLFGLVHGPTNIQSAFTYIGMGFMFAVAAKQTKAVEASILYHFIINLIAFIALYFF